MLGPIKLPTSIYTHTELFRGPVEIERLYSNREQMLIKTTPHGALSNTLRDKERCKIAVYSLTHGLAQCSSVKRGREWLPECRETAPSAPGPSTVS